MSRVRALVVLVLGCQGDPTPYSTGQAPRGEIHLGLGATARLPGTIWYVEDGTLASLTGGTRTVIAKDVHRAPRKLPDGRLVAIVSRAGKEQLVLVGTDLSVTDLAPPAARLDDPAIDPAGDWLVYSADARELVRVDLSTRERTLLRPGVQPVTLDAAAIIFGSTHDGNPELYRSDPLGGEIVRLTDHPGDDRGAAVSPDGSQIAFSSDRDGSSRIYLLGVAGGSTRRLTSRADMIHESRPVWSPDGTLIAYVSQRGPRRHVWLRDIASGNETDMTPEGMRDDDPCFSPDGRWLVVSRTRGHDVDLWALPTAVGDAVRVTTARTVDRQPYWPR
jgi:dipeptidyl aminopeptidase/acylaminoacyl peptidase